MDERTNGQSQTKKQKWCKKSNIQIYDIQQQTTDIALHAPDLGQVHTGYSRFKHICLCPTLSLSWDSGVTAKHKNKL